MLCSLLAKLKRCLCFRRESERKALYDFPPYQIFEIASSREPQVARIVQFVSHFVTHIIPQRPRRIFQTIKWFYQRGRRGWADCDTWSLDWYLDRWLPEALRYLKAHKQGLPRAMFEGLPTKDNNGFCPTDEAFRIAQERWNSILDRMIAGFEAGQRMSEGLYRPELGPELPWRRPAGVSADSWRKIEEDRDKAISKLSQRDQELFKEGMALFVEHYRSLWD